MPRRLFTLAAAVSLLLCAATCVMWVRSSKALEFERFQLGKGPQITLQSALGSLSFSLYPSNDPRGWAWAWGVTTYPRSYSRRWFDATMDCSLTGDASREIPPHVRAPHWLFVVATATPSLLWLLSRRDNLRTLPGLCPTCGYDLRATPNRCPECGTAAAKMIAHRPPPPAGFNPWKI